MIRLYTFIFLVAFLTSCKKKSVELPMLAVEGITDVYNHSQIWVFYQFDENKIKAEVNKNNTISTTNWIVNIDKKIPMREIVPVLEMIKNKRDKKTIHSAEGMHNYLSYLNTKNNRISLYNIDKKHYLALDKTNFENLVRYYKSDYIVTINENNFSFNNRIMSYASLNESLVDTLKQKPIHFFFDGSISFQKYLEKRAILETLLKDIKVDNTEYMIK